ncbi:phosphonate metabolism transcriptional regulator PhnF [Anaeroselena agilis]|uniref:Phosphonate metabolism transcriptional regulator PhnF n=1 Tax=Anaeroselena agilis TaxID=3063788 RepID=A0ABU3P0P9_9FIRM|nr:phosphonate metabolism transcriptional regulator PhnF [Selenomonadales bacterium 4137-cl]
MIERESGIPYYWQLMEIIRRQIVNGRLKEGQRIPSEIELSSAYRVNRHTVRQAIGELCRSGELYKQRGRGTFVAKPPVDLFEYRLSPKTSFTDDIREAGKTPDSRLLAWREVTAPVHVAEALGLAADERVFALDIRRLVNRQPFLFSKVFLSAARLPGLAGFIDKFRSLPAIYDAYGLSPRRVKSVFRASFPEQEEAVALDIPGNLPVLKVESVLKSQDGVLIEYSVSCYRSDFAKVSIDW